MKEYFVPHGTLLLWRIRVSAAAVLLLAVSVYLCFFSYLFIILVAAVVAAYLFLLIFYLPRLYGGYKIELCEDYISVSRGVFVVSESIMPSPRLIAVKRVTTPLGRMLGLCSLSLSAARLRLLLAPLSADTAQEIADLLGGGEK